MIKEEEIEYYRNNIINRYVTPIMKELAIEEQREKRIRRTQECNKKLKYHPNYKQCKRCGEVKPLTEFYKNILKSKGVFDYCKECAKKRQREISYAKKNNNNNR
jgi:hypothetical protein